MLGSLDHVTRQLIVHTSPTKRSSDFIAHLEQLDRLFGPQPGRQATISDLRREKRARPTDHVNFPILPQ